MCQKFSSVFLLISTVSVTSSNLQFQSNGNNFQSSNSRWEFAWKSHPDKSQKDYNYLEWYTERFFPLHALRKKRYSERLSDYMHSERNYTLKDCLITCTRRDQQTDCLIACTWNDYSVPCTLRDTWNDCSIACTLKDKWKDCPYVSLGQKGCLKFLVYLVTLFL